MTKPEIILETDDFLILNKPPFWHSISQAKTSGGPTLEGFVSQEWPLQNSLPEHGFIHRLDYETSGCVLIGRKSETLSQLKEDFRSSGGLFVKKYWAVVEGKCAAGEFDLMFTSRYRGSKKVSVGLRDKEGERGTCRWKVLKANSKATLLEVELLGPGKRHQIRAGFAHLKHPLLNDELYGSQSPNKGRFFLHCRSLESERWGIRSEAQPPSDWPQIWD